MNRPSEELLHKTLENRATAAEATSVAEWLATDSGQAWASRYIGRDFDRQEVASERIFARSKPPSRAAGAAAFFFASPPS